MSLDSQSRKIKIDEIKKKKPYSYMELYYEGSKQMMEVHKIDVSLLIFNKHNGRIGTYVKSYEKYGGVLDASNEQDEEIIIEYLWNSNKPSNKKTKQDIEDKEQLVPGIISADGIIVDGNRRAMILKKIAKERKDSPTYFIAAVLPDTLDEKPKEIRRLETMVQMGEDAKVDYNPIEKYVKCKDLYEIDKFDIGQISKMMGDSESKIREYLDILKLMDDYLCNHLKDNEEKTSAYEGMYSVLTEQKREGPFVDLNNHLKKHKSGTVRDRDWEPDREDIEDAKTIFFDHIRAGFGSQQGIRMITNPTKDEGFFSKKKLFNKFSDEHFETMDSVEEKSVSELISERSSEDPIKVILSRDDDFKNKVEDSFKKNLRQKKRELDDITMGVKPYELLEAAFKKIQQIDLDSDFSENPEVALNMIKAINKLLWTLQKPLEKKSK